MLSSRSSGFRAILAASMLTMLGSMSPALSISRQRIVPNVAGERLLPKPRPYQRRWLAMDYDKMSAAERKRQRRADKRLADAAAGGWIATHNWLARIELRKAVAAADAEIDSRHDRLRPADLDQRGLA